MNEVPTKCLFPCSLLRTPKAPEPNPVSSLITERLLLEMIEMKEMHCAEDGGKNEFCTHS